MPRSIRGLGRLTLKSKGEKSEKRREKRVERREFDNLKRLLNGGMNLFSLLSSLLSLKIVAQTTHKTMQFWYNMQSRVKCARRSIH